ncbi:MAG: hypothetical protein ABI824_16100 [Acidobacteriota bacterium]
MPGLGRNTPGIFGDRCDAFVRLADPVANRQGPFQNLFRHMGPFVPTSVA